MGGIVHLNKIYMLFHKHEFEDGHEGLKLIGSFFTKEKALKILDKCKPLPGFKDNLNGFYIQEVEVDTLNEKELKRIKKNGRH